MAPALKGTGAVARGAAAAEPALCPLAGQMTAGTADGCVPLCAPHAVAACPLPSLSAAPCLTPRRRFGVGVGRWCLAAPCAGAVLVGRRRCIGCCTHCLSSLK